mmetsp:Transcript_5702/g.12416  ORF Transcript_5702/g.12416 Transcript_5702/m.12416 type:complete len:96 (+) Transcript_5702:501-788(+)
MNRSGAREAARSLIDSPLRVSLTDGRVIIGRFSCLDKQQNILLTDTIELSCYAEESSETTRSERRLGVVIVPRKWVRTCHVEDAGENSREFDTAM